MKNSSMIFRMICLSLALALCISAITVLADNAADLTDIVTDEVVDATGANEVETDVLPEEVEDETLGAEDTTEAVEPEEEVTDAYEEDEYLTLEEAVLLHGGKYITPSQTNDAVFEYEGVRYRVKKQTANEVKLDGFERNPEISSTPIGELEKNILQANGETAPGAAHSGKWGLNVESGDIVYRASVTGGTIYVFSAWVNLPNDGDFNSEYRAFRVIGTEEYIVGYNEIGRGEEKKPGEWQQILFTFKAPQTGAFEMYLNYNGSSAMKMDDIELYEAEVFDNPIYVRGVTCTEADGSEFNYEEGFATTGGTITHTTVLYNEDESDIDFTAVMVLFKNNIMIDMETKTEQAPVLDETEVTFDIEIPEDTDASNYKYMIYFVDNDSPTKYYGGSLHIKANPYIVTGK